MNFLRRCALMLAMYLLVSGGTVPWVNPPTPPIPVVPVPPVPFPPPVPPAPVVDPAPISDPGFRVLFTYREGARTEMTPGQSSIWDSPVLRDYLDSHCAKGKNGIPEWRFWTDDQDATNDSPTMQKMLALVKGKPGMVVVSNGTRGTIQPWPTDLDSAMVLLKKYGGP